MFEPMVVNQCDISLIPLCQISGPNMSGWGVDHNISSESDGNFYQCSLQPNCWTTCYLHNDPAVRFPFLQTPKKQWTKNENQKVKQKKNVGEGRRCGSPLLVTLCKAVTRIQLVYTFEGGIKI